MKFFGIKYFFLDQLYCTFNSFNKTSVKLFVSSNFLALVHSDENLNNTKFLQDGNLFTTGESFQLYSKLACSTMLAIIGTKDKTHYHLYLVLNVVSIPPKFCSE